MAAIYDASKIKHEGQQKAPHHGKVGPGSMKPGKEHKLIEGRGY